MLPSRRNDQNWLPSMFNDFFSEEWPLVRNTNNAAPAINVLEDDKSYHVEIAAPGMTKNDFSIHVNDQDELVILVEKKEEYNDKDCGCDTDKSNKDCNCDKKEEKKCNCKYLRHEFSYSRFEQSLLLPDNVNKDEISAKVADGILRIELPKLDPTVKKNPRRVIDIQ
ncbi:MAG: Hsp20/alpha crystallin family protein [Paludibacteraceae bacterium]|nr:Hsp20/alpha crystallin family protein [Paludibacteraceae bacterium]